MALTYGFYDSIGGDRVYSSSQLSNIFNGIITDGVFQNIGNSLTVSAPTSGMYVIVGTGRAWFDGTWIDLDSAYPIPRDSGGSLIDIVPDDLPRWDAVVVEVNRNLSVRATSIKLFSSEQSSDLPDVPTRSLFSLEDTDYIKYHILAYVYVEPNATKIKKIINAVGTEETPIITGILESTSGDKFFEQWNIEFSDWIENNSDGFTNWWNSLKDSMCVSLETVATSSDLPNDPTEGDVYLVTDTNTFYKWNGTEYVQLNEVNDLKDIIANLLVKTNELERKQLVSELVLPANEWMYSESDEGESVLPYKQIKNVQNILSSDRPIIMPLVPDYSENLDVDEYLDQCNLISKFETGSNTITVYCYSDKPDIELRFVIKGR